MSKHIASVFLGIDPGQSGGIAVVNGQVVFAQKMPATERDVWDAINSCDAANTYAVIEKVGPARGATDQRKQGVSSAFKFGASYGMLRMALVASLLAFEAVAPQIWQKEFKLLTLKDAGSLTAKKNVHKARAQELFPNLKVTHAIADALLLAEYCRRIQIRRAR